MIKSFKHNAKTLQEIIVQHKKIMSLIFLFLFVGISLSAMDKDKNRSKELNFLCLSNNGQVVITAYSDIPNIIKYGNNIFIYRDQNYERVILHFCKINFDEACSLEKTCDGYIPKYIIGYGRCGYSDRDMSYWADNTWITKNAFAYYSDLFQYVNKLVETTINLKRLKIKSSKESD